MKRLKYSLLSMLLLGCSDEEYGFKPSDDVLANNYFEQYLKDAGIPYSKNPDGFFLSDKNNIERMRPLASKANEKVLSTSSVRISGECEESIVMSMIKDTDLIYDWSSDGDAAVIRTNKADADRANLLGIISIAKRDCTD
ncbi:hypothetical protein BTA51_09190 [Hahella sp. CCB-MM4]|nr:hypothetical protein BTA51_09190 [Hahella sp. CCB-MM4]